MKTMKKVLSILLVMLLGLGIFSACGSEKTQDKKESGENSESTEQDFDEVEENTAIQNGVTEDDIVILFTTDVHSKFTEYIGYDGVVAYKKEVESVCGADRVALADCGDCLDGSSLGENTSGQAIVSMMDQVGYDVATPGNHDFKFSVENLKELAQTANFCYLSCNLREISTGSPVLESYTVIEKGGKRLAFIGVTTSNHTHTEPEYNDFANEDEGINNPKYDFTETDLYRRVQEVVDEVRQQNVDYVILLTHLGYDSSADLIANTTGVDVVIDGHAHVEIEMEQLDNANQEKVIQTSSGEWLKNIGQLRIDKEGNITTKLIKLRDYQKKDSDTTQFIQNLKEMHDSEK